LPIAGDGPELFPALLLSGFFNLLVVAVAAPLAGRALRARRRNLPQVVAGDLAGTVLLAVLAAGLAGLGLAHRAQARTDRAAVADGLRRARADVVRNGAPDARRRPDPASTPRSGAAIRTLDADTVRAARPDAGLLAPEAFGIDDLLAAGMHRDDAGREVVLRACRELGVRSAAGPPAFPLALADHLRAGGVELA